MKIHILFENDSALCAFTSDVIASNEMTKLKDYYKNKGGRVVYPHIETVELDPKTLRPSF